MSVNEKMTAIGDAIRDKTGKTDLLTLDDMASGVNEVYDAAINRYCPVITENGEVVAINPVEGYPIQGLTVYGKTVQNGTPTPDAHVPLESAGAGGSIGVKVAGKNLIDFSKIAKGYELQNSSGTLAKNAKWYVTDWIPVEPSTVYVLSGTSSKFRAEVDENYKAVDKTDGSGAAFITAKNARFVKFNSLIEGYSTPQLELGDTATAYEKGKPIQTLIASTPNGLSGIPVTSGGNYTDANGQQWICDEIDFARGVRVQRIGKKIFNGTENLSYNTRSNSAISVITSAEKTNRVLTNVISSHFITSKYSSETMNYAGRIACRISNNGLCFSISHDLGADIDNCTQSEITAMVRDFLISQYESGTPVCVLYAMLEPIETPLSAEELAAYAQLHTNVPTTTIYTDSGAGLSVKYTADPVAYIEKITRGIIAYGGKAELNRQYTETDEPIENETEQE